MLPLQIEFSGGAEFLFDSKKSYSVSLPAREKEWLLEDLILWLKDNLLTERPELFVQGNSVRPGILVLINDTDWELLDTTNYILQPNDRVTFISTLHGG